MGMGPTTNGRIIETRDVPVPMRDGVELLADLYQPRSDAPLPVFLTRTPYGRRAVGGLIERSLALRGFQVVSQSCRGTFGSGREFLPFQAETEDGVDTLKWIAEQPWYSGQVVMSGVSYPGCAMWALAGDAPKGMLKTLVFQHASTHVYDVFRPHGTVALATLTNWVYLQSIRELGTAQTYLGFATRRKKVARAVAHLPQSDIDRFATGSTVPFFQQVLASPRSDDPLWIPTDHSDNVDKVEVPIHLMSGWYDFFLDPLLEDYARLLAAGKRPYLTIGAWPHIPRTDSLRVENAEILKWFRSATTGDWSAIRPKPVRLQLLGTKEWLEFDQWPPPSHDRQFFLLTARRLWSEPVTDVEEPSSYRYDPADPTRSVGGAVMYDGVGQLDNAKLEARPDVLTFTAEPLTEPLDVVGVPHVGLYVRSTAPTTDLFVQLCDVTPSGASLNLTEGIARLPLCEHGCSPMGRPTLRSICPLSPADSRRPPRSAPGIERGPPALCQESRRPRSRGGTGRCPVSSAGDLPRCRPSIQTGHSSPLGR
jgi:putative CocE/NonD family hydrolase